MQHIPIPHIPQLIHNHAVSQAHLDRPSNGPSRSALKGLLLGLCCFHSLVVGRKRFGTGIGSGSGSGLGWCRPYR